ncbi:MAG: hypothetical protein ABI863_01500 [Ginsengibacter sp.]
MKKNVFSTIMITLVIIFSLSACVEHRYYHRNHHHSPDYYHRHHRTPPPGVDIDIHN